MRKKKTAHETVAEVIAKVNEELLTPRVTIEAPKKEDTKNHYYRCNIALDNGKACNCSAFM
jgi:formate hydrogenlyase subunit 6/NADH:ubiquinone oxidoreductase subunit I